MPTATEHSQQTILLAVTGMSPAVITETLYGIAAKNGQWPKKILAITTTDGKEALTRDLIEAKHLEKLCAEIQKPPVDFSDHNILVVPDANGNPAKDTRTPEDHEMLADFIMTTVRNETAKSDTRIHASIAGGRKTMTFYLGYAMSLFGRPCDELSHVLVGEDSAQFEQCRKFFYPTQDDHIIYDIHDNKLNAKEASIQLADIPFIRQRAMLPERSFDIEGTVSFRNLINMINLGENPDSIEIHAHAQELRLRINTSIPNSEIADIEFKNPLHWALYLLLLEDSIRPLEERDEYTAIPASKRDDVFGLKLLDMLCRVLGIELTGRDFEEATASILETLESINCSYAPSLKRSLAPLKEKGFTNNSFSTFLNSIKKQLEPALSPNLLRHIAPKQTDQSLSADEISSRRTIELNDPSRKIKKESVRRIKTKSGRKGGQYYIIPLPMPDRQITIHW